jgi:hypothetical protein
VASYTARLALAAPHAQSSTGIGKSWCSYRTSPLATYSSLRLGNASVLQVAQCGQEKSSHTLTVTGASVGPMAGCAASSTVSPPSPQS